MPPPVPGTHRWDRKAIDLAWDRLSGITAVEVSASDTAVAEWRARLSKWDPDDIRTLTELLRRLETSSD